MVPYGATDGGVLAALLSVLQLSAACPRSFGFGHKSTALRCIDHGEMLFAAYNSQSCIVGCLLPFGLLRPLVITSGFSSSDGLGQR